MSSLKRTLNKVFKIKFSKKWTYQNPLPIQLLLSMKKNYKSIELRKYMPVIPPHFVVRKENKVVFLIKGVFPEHLILKKYMPYFPKAYKCIVMRCEESFYKMRMKVNSRK